MLKQLAPIFFTGIVAELLWIGVFSLGQLRDQSVPFLTMMVAAFGVCLWSFSRLKVGTSGEIGAVFCFALLFRLTVVASPPYQSEDVYRYVWDAKISAAGISPYDFPPEAPELVGLRDTTLYPKLNSKQYISVYPPLSQILFRLSYQLFGESIIGIKAVFSLLEFLSLFLIWRLLVAFKLPLGSMLLVAWNPLFIFEFSHSGHSESAMIVLMLLSVWLFVKRKASWAMASYAGALLVKLHPALWFPLFLRLAGWRSAVVGLVTGIGLALVYFTPSSWISFLGNLRPYFREFGFNAGIHYFVRFVGREAYDKSWDQTIGPYLAAAVLLAAILIWWKFPIRSELDILHAGFWIMTADVCLATTVHPWYLSWAAFALPFYPYAFMVYWTGACFLSYLAYAYQPVYEPTWVLLVQYLPMYGLMVWEIYRGRPLIPIRREK